MTLWSNMNSISKFIHLPGVDKRLLFEALFFLYFSKCILFLFPFKVCIKLLKPLESIIEKNDSTCVRKIRAAMFRTNKLAFWKNICLVKSFAARLMLQRRNISSILYLGLQMKGRKELIAHAWLISGNIYITPKGSAKFKEIFSV